MNLLCPNCGKMLTVPEQYAGQLMKCPLCSGTFTVPALPPGGTLEPAPAFAAQPQTPAAPDPYQLQPQSPAPGTAEPAFSTAPPPPPPPSQQQVTGGPTLTQPVSQPGSPGDYRNGITMRANEEVLKWVVPAMLVLIFFLQFFPWIGVYVGNVPIATQGAWGAAVGATTEPDSDLEKFAPGLDLEKDNRPGVSLLLLFYLFFFLVTLLVAIAVVVLPFIKTACKCCPQLSGWRAASRSGSITRRSSRSRMSRTRRRRTSGWPSAPSFWAW
jgi:hypothetical protein